MRLVCGRLFPGVCWRMGGDGRGGRGQAKISPEMGRGVVSPLRVACKPGLSQPDLRDPTSLFSTIIPAGRRVQAWKRDGSGEGGLEWVAPTPSHWIYGPTA